MSDFTNLPTTTTTSPRPSNLTRNLMIASLVIIVVATAFIIAAACGAFNTTPAPPITPSVTIPTNVPVSVTLWSVK